MILLRLPGVFSFLIFLYRPFLCGSGNLFCGGSSQDGFMQVGRPPCLPGSSRSCRSSRQGGSAASQQAKLQQREGQEQCFLQFIFIQEVASIFKIINIINIIINIIIIII